MMTESQGPNAIQTTVRVAVSLFDGLKGRGADNFIDVPTAVMIPLVAAMLADGRVEEEELTQIHSICTSSPIFERNSRPETEHLISRVVRMIEDYGLSEACSRARSVLSPALCETAFVHAVRVIFSDGHVSHQEREVVDHMIEWLKIDRDRARLMIEVVSIMQHPITA